MRPRDRVRVRRSRPAGSGPVRAFDAGGPERVQIGGEPAKSAGAPSSRSPPAKLPQIHARDPNARAERVEIVRPTYREPPESPPSELQPEPHPQARRDPSPHPHPQSEPPPQPEPTSARPEPEPQPEPRPSGFPRRSAPITFHRDSPPDDDTLDDIINLRKVKTTSGPPSAESTPMRRHRQRAYRELERDRQQAKPRPKRRGSTPQKTTRKRRGWQIEEEDEEDEEDYDEEEEDEDEEGDEDDGEDDGGGSWRDAGGHAGLQSLRRRPTDPLQAEAERLVRKAKLLARYSQLVQGRKIQPSIKVDWQTSEEELSQEVARLEVIDRQRKKINRGRTLFITGVGGMEAGMNQCDKKRWLRSYLPEFRWQMKGFTEHLKRNIHEYDDDLCDAMDDILGDDDKRPWWFNILLTLVPSMVQYRASNQQIETGKFAKDLIASDPEVRRELLSELAKELRNDPEGMEDVLDQLDRYERRDGGRAEPSARAPPQSQKEPPRPQERVHPQDRAQRPSQYRTWTGPAQVRQQTPQQRAQSEGPPRMIPPTRIPTAHPLGDISVDPDATAAMQQEMQRQNEFREWQRWQREVEQAERPPQQDPNRVRQTSTTSYHGEPPRMRPPPIVVDAENRPAHAKAKGTRNRVRPGETPHSIPATATTVSTRPPPTATTTTAARPSLSFAKRSSAAPDGNEITVY